MFEREFYDSDLDKIESEKEFLDKTLDEFTNFKGKFVNLAGKIIEACDENSIYDFLKNCDELEKLENHYNPISKLVQKFFKQTYKIKANSGKNLRDFGLKIKKILDDIKEYNTTKYTENFTKSVEKIKKLLDEEKEIIQRHRSSTNLNEKSKLYRQFLEKEKQIYEIYLSNSRIENNDFVLNHTHNSIKFDIKQFFKKIKSWNLFVISSFPLFGVLIFFPYFCMIGKFPSISISNTPITIFGALLFLCIFGFIIYQNYLIFKIIEYGKIVYRIFIFYNVILLIMISPFLLEGIFENYANFIYKHFDTLMFVCIITIIFFALYHLSKQQKHKVTDALFFVWCFLFDCIFIVFIYVKADDLEPFMIMLFFYFVFLLRVLSIGKIFDYKSQIIILIFILVMALGFFSGKFAEMARLGNYNDSFKADTEFVPPDILDVNLTNCGAKNFTCIEKIDENSIKFTNLKIIIVLDNKKYKTALNPKFECEIKDNNKSAICSVGGSKLLLDKTNLSCRSHLRDDNKTCSYEFETREKG